MQDKGYIKKIFALLIGLWMVAPILIIIPLSFTGERSFNFPPRTWSGKWYVNFFTDKHWLDSLFASIKIALATGIISTFFGTLVAYALTRSKFRGLSVLYTLVIAPMVVPLVIFGAAIYALFLKWHLTGSFIGFVMAHTVIVLPFIVITVSASLADLDNNFIKAAQICGATSWQIFYTIVLPIIAPGVLTGFIFAVVLSFDEIVVSLFLSDPYLRTLPVQMYTSVLRSIDPTLASAATLVVVLTMLSLGIAYLIKNILRRRGV